MRNILALDTSFGNLSIGYHNPQRNLALVHHFPCQKRELSEIILDRVHQILKEAGCLIREIDLFVITIGPGNFTSIRVGLSVGMGLTYQNPAKVLGVSSLLALSLMSPLKIRYICPVIDAHKKEIYTCFYEIGEKGQRRPLTPELLLSPAQFFEKVSQKEIPPHAPIYFTGNGAEIYKDLISRSFPNPHLGEFTGIDPIRLIQYALANLTPLADWSEISPNYIRKPDAVMKQLAGL